MLYVIDNGRALDRRVFVDGDHCLGRGLHCLRLQQEDGKRPSSSRSNNKAGWDWDWEINLPRGLFGWLVAGWCWFVLREEYY
jgi:hypothetical protein